ncbi:hypothetical protein LINPERHAP1_LOCUS14754 [Linum perenne]
MVKSLAGAVISLGPDVEFGKKKQNNRDKSRNRFGVMNKFEKGKDITKHKLGMFLESLFSERSNAFQNPRVVRMALFEKLGIGVTGSTPAFSSMYIGEDKTWLCTKFLKTSGMRKHRPNDVFGVERQYEVCYLLKEQTGEEQAAVPLVGRMVSGSFCCPKRAVLGERLKSSVYSAAAAIVNEDDVLKTLVGSIPKLVNWFDLFRKFRKFEATLLTCLLYDPFLKVRMASASALAVMLDSPSSVFVHVAEYKESRKFGSFMALSRSLGRMLMQLHTGLLHLIKQETHSRLLASLFKILMLLISATPYELCDS